jgi:hypothetical protein
VRLKAAAARQLLRFDYNERGPPDQAGLLLLPAVNNGHDIRGEVKLLPHDIIIRSVLEHAQPVLLSGA